MRIAMRTKGTAIIAVCAALVSGVLVTAPQAGAEDFSKPFRGFAPPNTVLSDASPASVGLDPGPIATAVDQIRAHESAPVGGHPMYAGAVGIMRIRSRGKPSSRIATPRIFVCSPWPISVPP